jgi:hypothetical protein
LFVPHAIPGKTMTALFQEKRNGVEKFYWFRNSRNRKNKIFLLRQENKKGKKSVFIFGEFHLPSVPSK